MTEKKQALLFGVLTGTQQFLLFFDCKENDNLSRIIITMDDLEFCLYRA